MLGIVYWIQIRVPTDVRNRGKSEKRYDRRSKHIVGYLAAYLFRTRYPRVQRKGDVMLTRSGQVWSHHDRLRSGRLQFDPT